MPDALIDNKFFYKFGILFLDMFNIITKTTLFLFLIGFFENKPLLFLRINFIVKFLLGVFLIYRFNNYRKYKIDFTELDRKVCYSIGMYMIIISLGEYLTLYIEKIRAIIIVYTNPYINNAKNITKIFK
jgi:hypothetical protein